MKPPQQYYGSGRPSDAVVKRYSYYECLGDGLTATDLAQMKALNPNARFFYYRNYMSTNNAALANASQGYAGEGAGQGDTTFFRSKGWLMRTSSGGDVTFIVGSNTEYMIDVGNAAYRAWLANYVHSLVTNLGYHGVFADNMPRPNYPPSWTVPTRGINPRTGAAYSDADFYTDGLALCQATRATGVQMVGNGIPQGDGAYGYFTNKARCDAIINALEGTMIEGPIAWSTTDSRTEAQWLDNVNFAKAILDKGKMCWWSNGAGTSSDLAGRFAYCTYMMQTPTPLYSLKYLGASFMNGNAEWNRLINLDLGASLGEYHREATGSQWFIKEYAGGKIRANPTSKASEVILGNPVTHKLTLSSTVAVPWMINGVSNKPAGDYLINQGATVTLVVPNQVSG
jgi:hypothetical protein